MNPEAFGEAFALLFAEALAFALLFTAALAFALALAFEAALALGFCAFEARELKASKQILLWNSYESTED